MLTVKTIDRQVKDTPFPESRALQVAPFQPFDTASTGRAFDTAQKTLGTVQTIYDEAKKHIDSTIGVETDLKLSTLVSNIENARDQLKGRDAVGYTDTAMKDFATGANEIGQTLTNDDQKRAYAARVAQHQSGLYDRSQKYSLKQFDQWNNDIRNAHEDLQITKAADNSRDTKVYEQTLSEIKAELNDRYHDPVIAEAKYNEHKKYVEDLVKERRINAEAQVKKDRAIVEDTANKELTDLQIDGRLTYTELRRRKDALPASNYKTWGNDIEADLKAKAKKAEEVKDDRQTAVNMSIEAMLMSSSSTPEDVYAFKQKTAQFVREGKLIPTTARTIINDAEQSINVDPARKATIGSVVTSLKADLKDGLMGKGVEGSQEYNKQIEALYKWAKQNPDKDPSEYYDAVSKPYKDTLTKRILDWVPVVGWGVQPKTTDYTGNRLEIQGGVTTTATPIKFPNAKQALDGNWYIPDPNRPGKFRKVD